MHFKQVFEKCNKDPPQSVKNVTIFFLLKASLKRIIYLFLFTEEHVQTGRKIRNLTREYFSQLDKGTIEKLYNLYKVDFEMFNYTPNF